MEVLKSLAIVVAWFVTAVGALAGVAAVILR